MTSTSWRARLLLGAAAITTALAGYRYACAPNRDNAIEAAYYLGISANSGNADAPAKLERLFPGDASAHLAFQHGLKSAAAQLASANASDLEATPVGRRTRARYRFVARHVVRPPGGRIDSAPASTLPAGADEAAPAPQLPIHSNIPSEREPAETERPDHEDSSGQFDFDARQPPSPENT